MGGKESLNECLGSAIKYYENNEAVFSDICTHSEGGGDVIFMWKELKIVDNRGNETISNKLTVKLSVAGHCRSSVIHYKHYTKKFIVTHFSCSEWFFNHNKNFRTRLELFNVS